MDTQDNEPSSEKSQAEETPAPLFSTRAPVPPPPPARSRLKLTYSIGIWLVLLLIVVVVFSPARDIVLNHFLAATPTAIPTLAPSEELFYIQATPGGSIYIDGQLLPKLPVEHHNPPLQLTQGQHLITWKSSLFKTLSCVVDVPSQPASLGCPYETIDALNADTNVRVVSFTASLSDLAAAQQTALKQKIQQALDHLQSSDTVQPGEQYLHGPLVGADAPATATQPLIATLHFYLDTDPTSNRQCIDWYGDQCTVNDQSCLQFCISPSSDGTSSPGSKPSKSPVKESWGAIAFYYPAWTYTTESGQVVAQDQPDATGIYVGTDHSMHLNITWDSSGWHVSIEPQSDPLSVGSACVSMHNAVEANYYGITQGSKFTNFDWHLYTPTNQAAGCLGIALPSLAPSHPQPAYFLYRFGVLVAVNSLAHSYFPGLPSIDTYEQGIEQSIAAQHHI